MPRQRSPRRTGRGGTPAPPPPPATLAFASATSVQTVQVASGLARGQIAITSTGGAPAGPSVSGISLSAGSGWLTAATIFDGTGFVLQYEMDPNGLAAGTTRTATITVTDPNGAAPIQHVVTFNIVDNAPPILGIASSTHLAQATVGGASPQSVTVQLLNVGGQSLGTLSLFGGAPTYSGAHTGWVSSSFNQTDKTLTLTFNTTGIVSSGSSRARFVIEDSVAINEAILDVDLQMGTATVQPSLVVSPTNIQQTIQLGANATQTVLTISNANGAVGDLGTISVSEPSAVAWMSQAIVGNTVVVTFSTTGLGAGAYTGGIDVAASAAPNSPVRVNVDITVASAASTNDPTLPTEYNPTVPLVTGTTFNVNNATQFQNALNNSVRGDRIVITAGTVLTGNFILPNKTGSVDAAAGTGWITIESSAIASLPRGTRLRPTVNAAHVATIQTANADPCLRTTTPSAATGGGWHFRGIRFGTNGASSIVYAIVKLGGDNSDLTSAANCPGHFYFSRCWVEPGTATQVNQRGILANCRYLKIEDSWLRAGYGQGVESQVVAGWNGLGGFTFENNHLEGSTENILFGGADPGMTGTNYEDMVFRRNYFYKPASYKGTTTVKNIFELKTGVRVLVERNVFDGCWTDGQVGFAILMYNTNQDGTNPTGRVQHVTFRQNLVRNSGAGVNLPARAPNNTTNDVTRDILIEDCYFQNLNVAPYTGAGRTFQFAGVNGVKVRRCTTGGVIEHAAIVDTTAGVPRTANIEFRDNVQAFGNYGWFSSNGSGLAAFTNNCTGTVVVTGNVLVGTSVGGYTGQTFVSTESAGLALGKGVPLATVQNWTSGVEVAR